MASTRSPAAKLPAVARRTRPPSPLGQLLDSGLRELYGGNMTRFARAIGAHRQTVYEWMKQKRPAVPNLRHRQGIADALRISLADVDALIVRGLGYSKVTVLQPQVLSVATLMNGLHSDDIRALEREALRMRNRDAHLREQRPVSEIIGGGKQKRLKSTSDLSRTE